MKYALPLNPILFPCDFRLSAMDRNILFEEAGILSEYNQLKMQLCLMLDLF